MILGIGIDIAQVDRFKRWASYSEKQLFKIFSEQELNDCLCQFEQDSCKYNLECLASRFAAKEAFFKALSAALIKLNLTKNTFHLLFTCQNVEIIKTTWDVPELKINWPEFEDKIGQKLPKFQVYLSLSHEKSYSVSNVIISI